MTVLIQVMPKKVRSVAALARSHKWLDTHDRNNAPSAETITAAAAMTTNKISASFQELLLFQPKILTSVYEPGSNEISDITSSDNLHLVSLRLNVR